MSANVSHGRGGAANIRPDDTMYTDGEIVREGPVGDQGDGKYSAARGGAGNIGGEGVPKIGPGSDDVYVPESAMHVVEKEQSHHVGRGGAGNEHHVHAKAKDKGKEKINQNGVEKEVPHESLFDKLKNLLHRK